MRRAAPLAVMLAALACGGTARTTRAPPGSPATVTGTEGEDEEAAVETGTESEDDALPAVTASTCTSPGSAALLAEVTRILDHARSSTYSHHTVVDEAAGRYELDCSGLVDYALARVCPDALEPLDVGRRQRPLAKHFVNLVHGLHPGDKRGRWQQLARAADLEPGDLVAWLKPADVVTHNTGHVMIVRAPVSVRHGEVSVPVIDSTSVRHGASDSRFAAKATGVGTGTIYLLVDDRGAPIGYRWSNGKKARDHATEVALGRIE